MPRPMRGAPQGGLPMNLPAGVADLRLDESSTDNFLMHCYKVVPCGKRYRHDWSVCPFAHQGEMAARRDPSKYLPVFCAHAKQRIPCPQGDTCQHAHNLFEMHLHPLRYRTELCQFGPNCNRPVCFFAHSPDQLRVTGYSGNLTPAGGIDTSGLGLQQQLVMLQMQQMANAQASGPLTMLNDSSAQPLEALRMNSLSRGGMPTSPTPSGPLQHMHSLNNSAFLQLAAQQAAQQTHEQHMVELERATSLVRANSAQLHMLMSPAVAADAAAVADDGFGALRAQLTRMHTIDNSALSAAAAAAASMHSAGGPGQHAAGVGASASILGMGSLSPARTTSQALPQVPEMEAPTNEQLLAVLAQQLGVSQPLPQAMHHMHHGGAVHSVPLPRVDASGMGSVLHNTLTGAMGASSADPLVLLPLQARANSAPGSPTTSPSGSLPPPVPPAAQHEALRRPTAASPPPLQLLSLDDEEEDEGVDGVSVGGVPASDAAPSSDQQRSGTASNGAIGKEAAVKLLADLPSSSVAQLLQMVAARNGSTLTVT